MTEVKTITHLVVVGGGAGGARLTKLIYEHPEYNIRVTLISAAKLHLHTPAAVRLCVKPDLYDKFTLDLSDLYAKERCAVLKSDPSQPRVEFIQGVVDSLNFDTKTISYHIRSNSSAESESDPKCEIKYDLLVLATGSRQCSPLWGFVGPEEKSHEEMVTVAKKLSLATRVAIIGAGATGIEVAAEIAENYPKLKKNINLYAGDNLPMVTLFGEARSKKIVARLTNMGVKVIQEKAEFVPFENRFRLVDSSSPDDVFDMVIPTVGAKLNLDYLKDHPELMDGENGLITDEYLRVRENVYAIGDIVKDCPRSWPDAWNMANLVLSTILVDLKKGSRCKLTKYDKKVWKNTKMVTLGKCDGVGILRGYPVPAFVIGWMKGSDFMVNNFADVKP